MGGGGRRWGDGSNCLRDKLAEEAVVDALLHEPAALRETPGGGTTWIMTHVKLVIFVGGCRQRCYPLPPSLGSVQQPVIQLRISPRIALLPLLL